MRMLCVRVEYGNNGLSMGEFYPYCGKHFNYIIRTARRLHRYYKSYRGYAFVSVTVEDRNGNTIFTV